MMFRFPPALPDHLLGGCGVCVPRGEWGVATDPAPQEDPPAVQGRGPGAGPGHRRLLSGLPQRRGRR